MIDKIITFGDSFLYGSDLKDCPKSDNFRKNFSNLTWPALIAKKLRLDYESYSLGGVGNQFIMEWILDSNLDNALVIINWTWIDRFDYHSNADRNHPYKTITPGIESDISKFYYKNLHSEMTDKLRNLSFIYTSLQFIIERGNPFISTAMDHLLFDKKWHMSQAIEKLQEKIKSHTSFFPNDQTFLEWSRANGYPESDNWHPLEQAHEAAAKYWLPIYQQAINTHTATTKD